MNERQHENHKTDLEANLGDAFSSRRAVGLTLLGALGGAALLKGCAPGERESDLKDPGFESDLREHQLVTTANIQRVLNISELRTVNGSAEHIAIVGGYYTSGDGGGGVFVWSTVSLPDNQGTVINPGSGNSPGWRRMYTGHVSVRWFGATGDGSTDDHAAFVAALGTGRTVFVPASPTPYLIGAALVFDQGGLVGEQVFVGGAVVNSCLKFSSVDSSEGALNLISGKNGNIRIENLTILAQDWDECEGFGVIVEAPVIMRNVTVVCFKRSNIWLHQNAAANTGPYQSLLENVRSFTSGEHGCLVSNGANAVTIVNYTGLWNGALAYNTVPSTEGSWDGLHVRQDAGVYPPYTPECLTIIGGDCSYNSRFGWNIHECASSQMTLGYAEGNLRVVDGKPKQVRVGNVVRTVVNISQMNNGADGYEDGLTYGIYWFSSKVMLGSKQLAPNDRYDFIGSPSANDDVTVIQAAPRRPIFLSRSDDASALQWIYQNYRPDGVVASTATESVTWLGGVGMQSIAIGAGAHYLKCSTNVVRLPYVWHWANAAEWDAPSVIFDRGSAAPSNGAHSVGSIRYNDAPASGGYVGWVCVTAGSPGTWKGFGLIA